MTSIREFKEVPAFRVNGFAGLFVNLALIGVGLWLLSRIILESQVELLSPLSAGVILLLAGGVSMLGLFIVQPNQSRVLTFFGRYVGTVRDDGFFWTNPFTIKKVVSLRVHNFAGEKLKVNDATGNPIEIAAVVVWRVIEPARALFDVEDYQEFVSIQSETALRHLASTLPYDIHEDGKVSLRGEPETVAARLQEELQRRLALAGVTITEARLSHLAYAPEIAQAMLRRQQAQAIIAARQQIVEGAVSMVEMALKRLEQNNVVHLDDERRAAMVNNLLVVLTGDSEAHPVINAGTLY